MKEAEFESLFNTLNAAREKESAADQKVKLLEREVDGLKGTHFRQP